MRTASAGFKTRLALAEASLCHIVTITRTDGTLYRLSGIDTDLVVSGDTYSRLPGFEVSSFTVRSDGTSPAAELRIPLDDTTVITSDDMAAGRFDDAFVTIDVVDFLSTGSGTMRLLSGYVGNVDFNNGGDAVMEIRGLLSRLGEVVIDKLEPNCPVDLGSARCRVPLLPDDVQRTTAYATGTPRGDHVRVFQSGSYNNRIYECTTAGTTAGSAPAYSTTVGVTTTDGTAVFTCREAWTRFATVATVTNRAKFTVTITEPRAINGWFDNGALKFMTGDNALTQCDVRRWVQSTSQVELWIPARSDIQVGDELYIHPGCDKTRTGAGGCTKFSNIWYFQGFDKVPTDQFKFSTGTL